MAADAGAFLRATKTPSCCQDRVLAPNADVRCRRAVQTSGADRALLALDVNLSLRFANLG